MMGWQTYHPTSNQQHPHVLGDGGEAREETEGERVSVGKDYPTI